MRFPATIDLKLRLALRVAFLSAVCLVAAFVVVLFRGDSDARARLQGVVDLVARDLSLQLAQSHWVKPAPPGFPDLQRIATPLTAPGLCIVYRDASGDARQSLCGGQPAADERAPAAFDWLYRRLFDPAPKLAARSSSLAKPSDGRRRPTIRRAASRASGARRAAFWR